MSRCTIFYRKIQIKFCDDPARQHTNEQEGVFDKKDKLRKRVVLDCIRQSEYVVLQDKKNNLKKAC